MPIYANVISDKTREALELPLSFLPELITAIVIFIVGWIIAWIVERIVMSFFRAVPFFDETLRSVGFEEITKRAGLNVNLGKFFGVLLKIFIIFVFLVAALDVLGLQIANQFLVDRVLGYIPSVISAALVMVIGIVVANFAHNIASRATRAAGVSGGLVAVGTKWAIVVFSALVALGELGIATEIVNSLIFGLIASISLALGLAFGLGGQQAAADFIERIKSDLTR